MPILDKRVMVRLSEDMYKELVRKARRLGHRPSTYCRFLIETDIDNGKPPAPDDDPDHPDP